MNLSQMNKIMKRTQIILFLLLFPALLYSQIHNVSGVVTDVSGETLPGVNVVLKGTTTGAITNLDGEYVIENIPSDGILVFSFIGMKNEEILIENQTSINVTMQADAIGIDEVVVVGYGTQKKSDITGAVVSFDTDILRERPQTNLVQALQGNMAGVSVTTSSSSAEDGGVILIRGKNSITAGNSPLIIMDGIPYDGSFSSINPNDVESMEILKDASSTAIYGSKGANGVILISTKKGSGKMVVSYSGRYSWDEVTQLPDMQNGAEYWASSWEQDVTNPMSNPSSSTIDLYDLFDTKGYENTSKVDAFMQGYPGQTWDEVSNAILAKYPSETHHDRATLLQIAEDFAYPAGGRNTDWIKEATRMGHKQQHNVSLSGSTDKMSYYVSGIYDKAEGIAKGDDFERMMFRVNMSYNLTKWATYGTNTSLGFYDRSGLPAKWTGDTGAFLFSPIFNAYNEDGSIDLTPDDNNTLRINPLENLLFQNDDKETRITTNHYIDVDVPGVKGLHYKLNTGYRWNYRKDRTYQGNNTVLGARKYGVLDINNRKGYAWTVENILSYDRDFGKHHLFLTALYSADESVSDNNGVDASGFVSDDRTYYQAASADILTANASYSKRNHISQMFRANYGFDNRYMLTGTVRRDGYSAFGNDTKFGVFPSVALGWNIANESFMETIDMVDVLKLRASYGVNGNEAISAYRTLPRLSTRNYINQGGAIQYGYYPRALSNPDLGWETTESFNIGLDYTLLNGKVRGTIDAYKSNTYDLLLNETISAINGTTSITRNIGETKNKGIEFQISTVNISNSEFFWRTDFNGTVYKSEIVNVSLKDDEGNYIDDIASEWFIGHPVDVNYDYVLNRVLQKEDFVTDDGGNYVLDENDNYILTDEAAETIVTTKNFPWPGFATVKDVNEDGSIGDADKVIIGNRNPDFLAGMTNTFKYKNWTFSFFLNSVWGVTKRNTFINNSNLGPDRKMNDIPFWTQENPTAADVLPGINLSKMDKQLYPYIDVNYVRVQDITLSYKFSKIKGLSNLEVYTNIKNLYTFTNYELDPEYDELANTVNTNVPRARSIILGVRMSF